MTDKSNHQDLMLDIETFATSANGLVVQVAMAIFDRNTAEVKKSTIINIDVEDSLKYGFLMEEETLNWWATQPKEIFESLQVNPFSCQEAYENIKKFIPYEAYIWSHATFDVPMLANFCIKVSGDKKLPWAYKNARDIRTIVDISGLDLDKYDWEKEKTHNALSDVLFQIKYTVDALNMIKYHCTQDQAMMVREQATKQLAEK